MKLDLSTTLLIALVLSPGLFALKSRNRLVPRSPRVKGTGEELAELVALSLATHAAVSFLVAVFLVLLGCSLHRSAVLYFVQIDSGQILTWASSHPAEMALLGSAYVLFSFFLSHCLGILYGLYDLKSGVTFWLLARYPLFKALGFTGTLGEHPILYDLLNTEPGADAVFVEAEMKAAAGFYSGQISEFAIVRDEDAHRPVYLIDPYFRQGRSDPYIKLDTSGVLLDLADVAVLLIQQTKAAELQAEPPVWAAGSRPLAGKTSTSVSP